MVIDEIFVGESEGDHLKEASHMLKNESLLLASVKMPPRII